MKKCCKCEKEFPDEQLRLLEIPRGAIHILIEPKLYAFCQKCYKKKVFAERLIIVIAIILLVGGLFMGLGRGGVILTFGQ